MTVFTGAECSICFDASPADMPTSAIGEFCDWKNEENRGAMYRMSVNKGVGSQECDKQTSGYPGVGPNFGTCPRMRCTLS